MYAVLPPLIFDPINKEYFRLSASTRVWEEAELFRDKLEESLDHGLLPSGSQPDAEVSQEATTQTLLTLELPAPLRAPAPLPLPLPDPPTSSALHQSGTEADSSTPVFGDSSTAIKARATIEKAVDAYIRAHF